MTTFPTTWLSELPPAECEERLRRSELGRLGVVIDGRPAVFPVCHVYLDGMLAFPSRAGTKLHAALSWPFVAFEVDGIDPDGTTGWSVMIAGHAEEITDPATRARLAAARTAPWQTDPSLRWIRVVPSEITGRRITAVPRPS